MILQPRFKMAAQHVNRHFVLPPIRNDQIRQLPLRMHKCVEHRFDIRLVLSEYLEIMLSSFVCVTSQAPHQPHIAFFFDEDPHVEYSGDCVVVESKDAFYKNNVSALDEIKLIFNPRVRFEVVAGDSDP